MDEVVANGTGGEGMAKFGTLPPLPHFPQAAPWSMDLVTSHLGLRGEEG